LTLNFFLAVSRWQGKKQNNKTEEQNEDRELASIHGFSKNEKNLSL
jgi:hypothetical protein